MSFLKSSGIVYEDKRIKEIKKEYSSLIIKLGKGDEYIENPSTSIENIELFLPRYNLVIEELSKLQLEYKSITGSEMDIKNKLNGF